MNIVPKNPVKTLITIAYIFVIFLLLAFVVPKAITYLLPFIVAFIISQIIKPIVRFLENMHIPKRIGVIFSMLLVIGILGAVVYFLSAAVVKELKEMLALFQETNENGIPVFIQEFINALPKNIRTFAFSAFKDSEFNISEFVFPSLKSAISGLGGAAGKLPSAFVFTIVLILSTYFMSYDGQNIKKYIKQILPKESVSKIRYIKENLIKAFIGYIKAQLILMSIVFCILLFGFLILDIKLALILAFVISLWDAIPVLGSGIILNPWAIICLIQGNYFRAIGLFFLYLIILLTRQLLEPKILSGQLGIHPLFTIMAMYVGLKTIGISGMILGPILLILIITILKLNSDSEKGAEV